MLARFFRHWWCAYWQAGRLFPVAVQQQLAEAIARAEEGHAGEICVVVEASLAPLQLWRGMSPRVRALEVFAQQRVWDTEANSGVLVYLLLADHAVEIVADRGLGAADDPVWSRTAAAFREAFRSGRIAAGCVAAIDDIGAELRQRFPSAGPNPDELSNPVRML